MIDMIINDNVTKKKTYLFYKENKISGYGFINNELFNIDKYYVDSILNSIRLNKNCKYMSKYEDNDFYYDEDNGLKHFIKDGKENIDLFIKYNTTDGLVYYGYNDKLPDISHEDKPLKLKIKEKTILITKSFLATIFLANALLSIKYETQIRPNYEFLENTSYTEILEIVSTPSSANNIESIIMNNSNLEEKVKDFIINKDLLEDVVPYYNGTHMEYIIKLRLQNLSIEYVKDIPCESFNETGDLLSFSPEGMYNELKNDITIKDCHKENKYEFPIISHEFIHLLQENYKYPCIYEPSAELISTEYFDFKEPTSYETAIDSLKLLMDIVGSKVIWEYNFNNPDVLDNLFKENLSNEEYEELVDLLSVDAGSLSDEGWDKINSMYYKIAKNIMNEEEYNEFAFIHLKGISNNTNDEEKSKKYYFNRRKMVDTETYFYKETEGVYHCQYLISEEEYNKYLNEGKEVEEITVWNDLVVFSGNKVILLDTKEEMSVEEALKRGFGMKLYYLYVSLSNDEYNNLSEEEKEKISMVSVTKGNTKILEKESFINDSRYIINSELVHKL